MNEPASDSLQLSINVARPPGAARSVRFTFEVRNVSGRDLELYLRGREPTVDARVRDASGSIVWRSLEGAVPAILQLLPLAAGAAVTITEQWQPERDLAPGTYTLEGELLLEMTGRPFPATTLQLR